MNRFIGFGTYRISVQNPMHIQALVDALEAGVTLIDTSTNYMDGDAERAVGLALARAEGDSSDVEIVSKFGYMQGSVLEAYKADKKYDEVVEYNEGCYHCIAPDFMRDQLSATLERLGRKRVDCYLVHNPEYYLLDAIGRGSEREASFETMSSRLYTVFVALEEEVANGRIGSYGVSSNSFARPAEDPEFLPYEGLLELAAKAASEAGNKRHAFGTIQLPINLLEREGMACAAWAHNSGVRVLANRPLNAQKGALMYRLADYEEPAEYYHRLNEMLELTEHPVLKPLHNLVGQLDDAKNRFGWVGEYEHFLYSQIVPHVRRTLSALQSDEKGAVAESLQLFFETYGEMVAHECAKATRLQLKEELAGCDESLQACAIKFLAECDDIDYILVGMRKPSYVAEIMSIPL